MQIAWLFPGQGSQAVGMGKHVLEASAAAREVFARADAALGEPLSKLILEGPEADLTLTANAQPAIVTTSIAILAAIRERHPTLPAPRYAAGHSLGEYSALVAAGALSLEDAVRVVRVRGLAMQEAVPPGLGTMSAIVGVPAETLEAICAEVSAEKDGEGVPYGVVSCANYNAPGQIVIAGDVRAVGRASDRARAAIASGDAPPKRASSIPLRVSAPFHCRLMAPAARALADALAGVDVRPLAFPIVANVDARPNADPQRVKDLLVQQVVGAVRWQQAVQLMVTDGVTGAIEIGPGRVLAGLCRRIAKDLKVTSVGDTAGLEALRGFLAREDAA